jgi:uncharacterized protein YdbL (DUF1318 family)
MRTFAYIASLALCAGAVLTAGPVSAQSEDSVVAQARSAGQVGEQADGYLGIAGNVSPEVKAHVDQINIKRRAAYTELASSRGVTVSEVAAAAACHLLRNRVAPGQTYRDEGGSWRTRSGSEPVALPGYCS